MATRYEVNLLAASPSRNTHLSLDGVEELDALLGVDLLELGVLEGGHRKRLQVQEFAVRRVLRGEDQVTEAHRKHGLAVHPPAGHTYGMAYRTVGICHVKKCRCFWCQ